MAHIDTLCFYAAVAEVALCEVEVAGNGCAEEFVFVVLVNEENTRVERCSQGGHCAEDLFIFFFQGHRYSDAVEDFVVVHFALGDDERDVGVCDGANGI